MTAVEYFAALPEPVQAELVRIVRAAADMSREEKVTAMSAIEGACQAFLEHGGSRHMPAIVLLASAGEVVAAVDRDAFPREPQGV